MNEVFEKIIEKLEKEKNKDRIGVYSEIQCDAIKFAYGSAKEIVQEVAEEFATDTNVGINGWIPCSERLPEEELKKSKKERGSEAVFPVLATINKKHIITGKKYTTVGRAFYGCYHDKNFYNSCCDKLDVIAWQPLPAPYTKGE